MYKVKAERVSDGQGEHRSVCARLEVNTAVKYDCIVRDREGITLRKHFTTLVHLSEYDRGNVVGFVEPFRQICRFVVRAVTLRWFN